MTGLGRALLGAALGAAATLLLHPASRPYLLSTFVDPVPRPPQPATHGIPNKLTELSDWMLAVADRSVNRQPLSKIEIVNAIAAAKRGSELDPRNAFWPQMLACLYHQRGDKEEAKRQWLRAAECDGWNDYQSVELLQLRDRIASAFGASQSWQFAYVYYQRNENAVLMIGSFSRSLLPESPLSTPQGLMLRAANVQNGFLLREGSRCIRVGAQGAEMVELACHPQGVSAKLTHHKLFTAQVAMHTSLIGLGKPLVAEQVRHIYREAEAWDVYTDPDTASERSTELSFMGILLVAMPSTWLVLGGIGAVLWLTGRGLARLDKIEFLPALAAGLLLGIAVYEVTALPLASIATLLCCVALVLGPRRERRIGITDLGPMFSFTIGTLGIAFALLLGAFVLGVGMPAVSILPHLGVPREYFNGSGVLLGLAIIILAILLLMVPMFSIALRVSTAFVLSTAIRKFGAFLALLSLAFVVLSTPICIWQDRKNSEPFRQIVGNEPVYYLSLPR